MEPPQVGAGPPRPLGPVRKVLLVLVGLVTALMSIAAGGSIVLLKRLDASIDREPGLPVTRPEPQEPVNVLVLGSDSRAGLTEQELKELTLNPEKGQRSDTIILVHFDPQREKAVLVHFPRDLRTEIPGHGTAKINEAFRLGGANLMIRTVQRFSGLPIHHYVKVDFSGFLNLVDAVGGVQLCVDRPMYDEKAGLRIAKAGCYTFDGRRALAFVRARHVEGDLIPDFSRISRQQQFIRALLNKLLSVSSLVRLPELARLAADSVTTDDKLSATDILYLADRLRDVASRDPGGARSVDLRVVPANPEEIGGVSYVVAKQPETSRLLRALREGRPLGNLGKVQLATRVSPAVIRVSVLDAGDTAEAQRVLGLLRRAGFIVLGVRDAPRRFDANEIISSPRAETRAETVAGYFPGLPSRVGPGRLVQGADVVIVVAEDLESLPS
jgi:LCP family protein required for cell wall assembly